MWSLPAGAIETPQSFEPIDSEAQSARLGID
jgi:hypothetical protein